VKLAAEKPALWAWLSLADVDARYSDNFVHLEASSAVEIEVTPGRSMSLAEFERALALRSLFDTYAHTA
jgi:hypothetical protein